MSNPLRVLLVEDSADDAELLIIQLRRAGYAPDFERVETAEEMRACLENREWDLVLSDYNLPKFSAPDALAIMHDAGQDLPFIVLSGVINTEEAVTIMRAGAHDFVRKDDMARLAPAIERELAEAESQRLRKRAEEALHHSGQRLTAAQSVANLGNWQLDIQTNESWWSDEMYRILGHEPQSFTPTVAAFLEAVHPEDQAIAREVIDKAVKSGKSYDFDHRILLPDGTERVIHERAEVLRDEQDDPVSIINTAQDITDRKQVEETLLKLNRAVEQSPASVMITDRSGRLEYVNPKFVEVTGYSADEVVGKHPLFLESGYPMGDHYGDLWHTITSGQEWHGELHNRRKNGELFWEYASFSPITDAEGVITHFLATKEDITVRKEYEDQLLRQANFDDVTGLPNRVLAMDRLSQALVSANEQNRMVAIMYIDLDRFKNVNDTLGHAAGDQLLKEVAQRFLSCVHESDTVARLGGDEFLIILTLDNTIHVETLAAEILEACTSAFMLDGHEMFVSATIGMTVYPDDGANPHVLLRNADAAMYQAKEKGRNTYMFFTPEMNAKAIQRLELETKLRRAMENEDMLLNFQPLVEADTGRLVGVEALIRWGGTELAGVGPHQSIEVAEETGLIVPLGEWVLRTACEQVKSWQELTDRPLRISVNVSARQFKEGNLVELTKSILKELDLSANLLELEITEGLLLSDDPETDIIMRDLSDLGVRLAIDDFGTGYSSLSYLKRFPFDVLKIDRAFIKDVTTDPEDAALTRAIIAMAHGLGLKVIGEGVETEEQLAFLQAEGCNMIQGYLVSRPMDADAFTDRLKRGHQFADVPKDMVDSFG
jgi:diguanylate cyclase (GGDEF)-like protein/PAS domain S-box-containing protein